MSVVLWPRQEVLQLVIPQLGNVGRGLNQFNAFYAISKLSKHQNSEGKIRYSNWYTVAKDLLKWNDYCISLFWELLITAASYLHHDISHQTIPADISIDIECMAIFLVMHMTDNTPNKPTAPTVAFESVWPLNSEGEVFCSSPVASPSSPARDINRRAHSPMSSPMSPRSANSPRNSPQKPSSPRTTHTAAPRTPRASTQHLHSVRQKIPLILRAMNSSAADSLSVAESEEGRLDFPVNRRISDALGLILCGGHSRDQSVPLLSALHPIWSSEAHDMSDGMEIASTVLASDLVSWVNLHLSMNDLLYPALLAPSILSGTATGRESHTIDDVAKEIKSHPPQKVSVPLASLSRFSPTVISTASSTTILHVVTSGSSRTPSFRRPQADKQQHASSFRSNSEREQLQDFFDPDVDIGVTADAFLAADGDTYDAASSPPRAASYSTSLANSFSNDDAESKYDLGLDNRMRELTTPRADAVLPQLFISYCQRSKLYMISPYYSATVTGCVDADIVIGAVFGALIVNGCERVRITCACRRLVIINCLECEFAIASLAPTIIIGDCRSLTIGPYNTNYRNLRHHLRLAELNSLLVAGQSNFMNTSSHSMSADTPSNQCTTLCDVNACLDLASTGAGAGAGAGAGMDKAHSYDLPIPPSATAVIQSAEKFHAVVIPVKSEHLALDACPLYIPREYKQQLIAQRQSVEETKLALLTLLRSTQQDEGAGMAVDGGAGGGAEVLDAKLLSSSLLVKKFMPMMAYGIADSVLGDRNGWLRQITSRRCWISSELTRPPLTSSDLAPPWHPLGALAAVLAHQQTIASHT